MLKDFRSYQLAIELYHRCKGIPLPYYLRDQLRRAASSICLNLAEGSAKPTQKERLRFYTIAFASLREVQLALSMVEGAIADLEPQKLQGLHDQLDHLAACLYRLTRQ